MRKKFILMGLILFLLTFSFACNNTNDTEKDDNYYAISIYEKVRKQKDATIEITDYKLYKTIKCSKTQMFELPNYGKEFFYNNGLDSNRLYNASDNKKYYYLPTTDMTIFFVRRSLKSITLFYNEKEISEYLSNEDKEQYLATYKNTYEESFDIFPFVILLDSVLGNSYSSFQLYLDKNFTKSFYPSNIKIPLKNYSIITSYPSNMNIITSRTLYIKFI